VLTGSQREGGGWPTRKQTFDRIPGLLLFHDYFSAEQRTLLVRQALELYDRLEEKLTPQPTLKKASIPQPAFARSAKHKLSSEEHYARLHLAETNQREIRCEYFPRYAEDGHALCYFQGNANLPAFVRDEVIGQVRQMVEQEGFVTHEQPLTWKLTMNFYKSV